MWVQPLGQEGPLEEAMAAHSGILAWRIPWAEEPGGLQPMGAQSQTRLKQLSRCTVHVVVCASSSLVSVTVAFHCMGATICLSIQQLINICVVSGFWPLQTKHLWTLGYKSLCGYMPSFFLGNYLRVEQMGLRVGVFRIQEDRSKPNNKQKVNQSKSRQRL